ncbi:MAP kinase kinase Wis1 [Rhodotorula toruloides]
MADSGGTPPAERDFQQLSLDHHHHHQQRPAGTEERGTGDEDPSPRLDPSGRGGAPLTEPPADGGAAGAQERQTGVDQPTAVLTEEAVGELSSRSPVNGATSDDGGKGASTDGSTVSTLSSLGTSSASSLSPTPAPGPSTTRSPPPLHPRASAPATAGPTSPPPASAGGVRKPMPPGGGGGGGVPGRQGGPLRMPPSLAAKMAAAV